MTTPAIRMWVDYQKLEAGSVGPFDDWDAVEDAITTLMTREGVIAAGVRTEEPEAQPR